MARVRDPNRNKAFDIYKKAKGNIDLVEIASQLNVSPGTIRGWKSKDEWDNKLNGTFQKNTERSKQNKNVTKPIEDDVKQVMDNLELTDKQRLFLLYMSKCHNGTKAYQKAYECDEYTARVNASKLLTNANIRAEYDKLVMDKFNKAYLNEADIFQKYMDIAFADITDFLDFGREEVPVMTMFGPMEVKDEETGEKVKVTKIVNTVRFKESCNVDGSLISEVKQGKDGASIKLHDRMKALEWLSAHMDMATEKQRLEMAKLKYEVSQLSGGGDGNTGIQDFLKAVKPSKEDIDAMFADEEVIDDAEEIEEE